MKNIIKTTLRTALILLMVVLIAPVDVLATMSEEDREAVLRDAMIHQTLSANHACTPTGTAGSTGGGDVSTSVTLTGNDNLEKIFRFFKDTVGLTAEQAAGIAGNAMAESGGNPAALSRSGYRGVFQWDGKGRFAQLEKWTAQKGLDPNSLEGQLAFTQYEAGERGNLDGIKAHAAVDMATWFWGRYFEVAIIGGSRSETPLTNVQHLDKRIKYAQEIFNKYGGGESSGPTTTLAGTTGCQTVAGEATVMADGFVVYSQYDPRWKDKPFGTSTIGPSGCGPSAMAMAITNLTGQSVTPDVTAAFAGEKGLYIEGAGSSWSVVPVLAANWGLRSEPVGKSMAKWVEALRAGGLIVTSGKGAKPFTKGGHYIVVRAISENGKFLVGDSGHSDTSDKEWEPDQIMQSTPGGSAYAVYK